MLDRTLRAARVIALDTFLTFLDTTAEFVRQELEREDDAPAKPSAPLRVVGQPSKAPGNVGKMAAKPAEAEPVGLAASISRHPAGRSRG